MKIKSKTMLGVSLFAMTFSFSATAQTCKPVPSCESLGYTATSCSGDSIKCPFDTSKLYCIIMPHPCNSSKTKVGDIYYEGDMCADGVISGLAPIGVVYDTDRKLVLSLDRPLKSWHSTSSKCVDLSLTNYTDESTAQQDFNGKSNTDTIVAFAQSSGRGHEAAQYCHDMTTGGKTWYLPALGEMMAMQTNYSTINTGLSKAGGKTLGGSSSYYWSSTEYGECLAWWLVPSNGNVRDRHKLYSDNVRCIFAY